MLVDGMRCDGKVLHILYIHLYEWGAVRILVSRMLMVAGNRYHTVVTHRGPLKDCGRYGSSGKLYTPTTIWVLVKRGVCR